MAHCVCWHVHRLRFSTSITSTSSSFLIEVLQCQTQTNYSKSSDTPLPELVILKPKLEFPSRWKVILVGQQALYIDEWPFIPQGQRTSEHCALGISPQYRSAPGACSFFPVSKGIKGEQLSLFKWCCVHIDHVKVPAKRRYLLVWSEIFLR